MKKHLLLLAFLGTIGVSAQTTHNINWGLGDTSTPTSITIEEGDTVIWTWTTTHPHTVTSMAGSQEEFDSGIITGMNETYDYIFTEAGTNPYECTVHTTMNGTITVEATAGVEENMVTELQFYPNPTSDILTITAKDNIDRIEIYDMNGRLVLDTKGGNPTSKIYMQNYNAGTYLVKVFSAGQTKTLSVIKK